MWIRLALIALCVICFANAAQAKEERWYNFAEDNDLRYFIDTKSIVNRSGDIHIFWVRSMAKNKQYFKEEYNMNDLASILTNYEMDCSDATYRVRQTVMLDRNRRELNKSVPAGAEAEFEPIPPESSLELAQEIVCADAERGSDKADDSTSGSTTPVKPAESAVPPESDQGEEAAGETVPSLQ